MSALCQLYLPQQWSNLRFIGPIYEFLRYFVNFVVVNICRDHPQPSALHAGLLLLQAVPVPSAFPGPQGALAGLQRASRPVLRTQVRGDRQGHADLGNSQERQPGLATNSIFLLFQSCKKSMICLDGGQINDASSGNTTLELFL